MKVQFHNTLSMLLYLNIKVPNKAQKIQENESKHGTQVAKKNLEKTITILPKKICK